MEVKELKLLLGVFGSHKNDIDGNNNRIENKTVDKMLENKTRFSIGVFIIVCQMIIWKVYMDINYSETYKMDGKISDPRGDPGASRLCPGKNDFLIS